MARSTHPLLMLVAALTYAFLIVPLVIIIGASLTPTTYLAFPPPGLSLRWFENIFQVSAFRDSFVTSIQVGLAATTLALAVGIPAAYALARHRIVLPRGLANLFVLPILIPEIVAGLSMLKYVVIGAGLPVVPALILGHTIIVLPYTVRVVGASLAAFDMSVAEAAISLGSPPLRAFVKVVLPNIRSGVIAAFILALITSMNDVSLSLFLTGPGVSTLPIQLLAYVEQFFDPTVASVSVLLMLFTVAVMAIVERTLGLTFLTK